MGQYAFGFTINYDAIHLAVVEKTMFGYRLRTFLESPFEKARDALSREHLIANLTEIFDHEDFAVYRDKMESKGNRFHLAVAIPPEFVWMFQIPFLSIDDLYDSHKSQKAIDEILNYKILHSQDFLAYDSFMVENLRNPHIQLLVTLRSVLDELLGNKERDSIFEHTGFQKPQAVISFNQALLSFYSVVLNSSHQNTVFVYLHEDKVDFTFLENQQIHKVQTIHNPKFSDIDFRQQKLHYCRHLLFYIRLFLMYRIGEGKIAECIFLFGESKHITIRELHSFIQAVLGKTPEQIDVNVLQSLFGNGNIEELFPHRFQDSPTSEPQLKDHIYEKMLQQEQHIEVMAISSSIMKKFGNKHTQQNNTPPQQSSQEGLSGTNIMKAVSDFAPSSKQILPFGVGLQCFSEQEQPNLAQHGKRKEYSFVAKIIQGYLPDSVLNTLVFVMLLYVAATAYNYWQVESYFTNYQQDQKQGLNTLLQEYAEINWRDMPWDMVSVYDAYAPKPVNFFDIRRRKVPWSLVLQVIDKEWQKLNKDEDTTIIKNISFEIGLDDRGEKSSLIHIQGQAKSATDVLKALSQSDYIVNVALGSPIEEGNGSLESFYIIAAYE